MTYKKTLCEKIKKVAIFLVYPAILLLATFLMPCIAALSIIGFFASNDVFSFSFCILLFIFSISFCCVGPFLLTIIALKKWGNYFNKYFDNMLYPSFLLAFVCLLMVVCKKIGNEHCIFVEDIVQNGLLPHVIIIFIFFAVRTIVKRLKKKK